MTIHHSTFRWFASLACTTLAVGPTLQLVSTILITACKTKITDVLLLGTLWAFGGTDVRHVSFSGAITVALR